MDLSIFFLLAAAAFALLSFSFTVTEHRARMAVREQQRPIAAPDPFVAMAMAELDAMDEVLGILPESETAQEVGPFGLKPDWEMMDTMTRRNVTSIQQGGVNVTFNQGGVMPIRRVKLPPRY